MSPVKALKRIGSRRFLARREVVAWILRVPENEVEGNGDARYVRPTVHSRAYFKEF